MANNETFILKKNEVVAHLFCTGFAASITSGQRVHT